MHKKRDAVPSQASVPKPTKRAKPEQNPYTKIPYSQRYFKLLSERSKLPAHEAKPLLLSLLEEHNILIIQGETGSGKTTQIPQFILENDQSDLMIAVTQPRRIAAISVARRVAEETDTTLGDLVGYTIRFDDCTSEHTKLKYLTDGMLLRELVIDRNLTKYSTIIIDEAHERSLNTDILLGVLKSLALERKIRLIVMSATIEVERFAHYFDKSTPILSVPGRQHPVELYYTPKPEEDYFEACIRTTVQIHLFEAPGDVLVFLTGEEEVEEAVARISDEIEGLRISDTPRAIVYALYGALSAEQQQRVFEPVQGARKIIVSTNIAETSVTLDGMVYVVDCGLAKQKVYNPRLRCESLLVSPISKASARQRAGRAGRTRPGKCFRLYTEETYENELKDYSVPEILRAELSATILDLKMLGIENIVKFDFLDPPSPETVLRALETLVHIGAISPDKGEITPEGTMLGHFPLEPRMAKTLLKAKELGCADEVLDTVSVLNSGNWRLRPYDKQKAADLAHKKFAEESDCDLWAAHKALHAFAQQHHKKEFAQSSFLNFRALVTAESVRSQLKRILFEAKTSMEHNEAYAGLSLPKKLKVCFLSGYFQQIAHLQRSGMYSVFKDFMPVLVHPSSLVRGKPEFLMYLEFVLTSKQYIRSVTHINPEWLLDMFPDLFDPSVIMNTETKRALENTIKAMKAKQAK